jgi:serine phosphatase RsbU (regulator of sigma subunit)/anti-sigma regulatory factor (Ser/Thr protein kinase)
VASGGSIFSRDGVILLAKAAGVAGVYFVAAKLSLRLALVGESVTPLWPPTGIALVGFLWFGPRIWPGVALAAFLVNLPISPSVWAAAGIAAGNTVAPILAQRLLEAAGFRRQLDRLRDALALVFLGALASMTVSATAGTASLVASDAPLKYDFASTWSVWWAGDAMGILAVAPFLLSLRPIHLSVPRRWLRVVEAAAVFAGIAVLSYSIHRTARPVWVAVFPLLGWAAWRFQQRGAGPAALIVILVATFAAAHDQGPFAGTGLLDKMVMLQVFNAAVSFTSFFFAAVVAERERSETARLELVDRERQMQAQLYERERRVAESLQRSLLPERLPDIPDVRAVARYVPAAEEVEVGGDWYDVISLPDGRLGLGVGDVAGHGVGAAAAMGQVRVAFRAFLLEGLPPAQILERLNRLLWELLPGAMTTLVCAQLDPETTNLIIARAGHPPPVVRGPAAAVRLVEGGLGPPLGVAPLSTYEEIRTQLPPGAAFILYTDGLVERRRESLDTGLRRLLDAAAEAPDDLDFACDEIIARLLGVKGVADDVALLAIQTESFVGRPLELSLPAVPERLAPMRQIVGRWLRQNGIDSDAVADIMVAITEACSNVVQHAYGPHEGVMDLAGKIEGGEVAISVRDFGMWKPPGDAREESSRGLPLMRGLMDSVEVSPGPTGTTVQMRRSPHGVTDV